MYARDSRAFRPRVSRPTSIRTRICPSCSPTGELAGLATPSRFAKLTRDDGTDAGDVDDANATVTNDTDREDFVHVGFDGTYRKA